LPYGDFIGDSFIGLPAIDHFIGDSFIELPTIGHFIGADVQNPEMVF
jgi:hypothetical protein